MSGLMLVVGRLGQGLILGTLLALAVLHLLTLTGGAPVFRYQVF